MSATLMPEAEALRNYLQLHVQQEGRLLFSGFMHALREARQANARDAATGLKLAGSEGKHGSWLGAVRYFALLDQIGKCVKPRSVARVQGNTIRQALKHFSDLRDPEIDALNALRCAFAHDYSLINANAGAPSLTHVFSVGQGATATVVVLPATRWTGDLTAVGPHCQTVVSLEAFGDLAENIVAKLHQYAAHPCLRQYLCQCFWQRGAVSAMEVAAQVMQGVMPNA